MTAYRVISALLQVFYVGFSDSSFALKVFEAKFKIEINIFPILDLPPVYRRELVLEQLRRFRLLQQLEQELQRLLR